MKFTINKSALKKVTQNVYNAIPTKPAKPIMASIKVSADDKNQSITLEGTDGLGGIIDTVDANKDNNLKVSEKGSIAVAGRFFKTVVGNMPNKQITMYSDKHFTVRMKSGRSNFKIRSLDASNFPNLNLSAISSSNPVTVKGSDLKDAISNTGFSASTLNSRPIIEAIHLVFSKDKLIAEATDSFRGAGYQVPIKANIKNPIDEIISSKIMKTVKGMLNANDDVDVYFNGTSQVIFKQDNLIIYTVTTPGQYPDVRGQLKKAGKLDFVFKVNAKDLCGVVKRASIMSHMSSDNAVQLHINAKKNIVTVTSNSKISGQTKESMPIDTVRKPASDTNLIELNPDYIQDTLNVLGDTELYVGVTDSTKPTFWQPVNDKHHFLQFIVPIKIN